MRLPIRMAFEPRSPLEAVLKQAEGVSIVTPTVTHHELASQFLKAGRHVLVEKPITDEATQAGRVGAVGLNTIAYCRWAMWSALIRFDYLQTVAKGAFMGDSPFVAVPSAQYGYWRGA